MARITPEERQQNLNKFLSISKVRNGAGDPVVLYHVTPKNFSTFKAGGHDPEISGPATWLTPHKGHYPAWHNVGGDNGDFKPGTNVMPVHANITSPLVLDTPEMLDWARHVYANKSIDFPHYIHPETKAQLVEDGYDGIFFAGFHGKRHGTVPYDNIGIGEQPHKDEEIIALHPETQLKSAIGNNGNFDPSIPDVTKAEGGEVDDTGITAYHGSPHDFERFDMSKIGTGERAQAFGHGLYFAQNENVAKGYRPSATEDRPVPVTIDGQKFHTPTAMQKLVAQHRGDVDAVYKGMTPNWDRAAAAFHAAPQDPEDLERLLAEDDHKKALAQRAEIEGMRGKKVAHDYSGHRGDQALAGHTYEVHINAKPDHFLDWDRPIREQPHVMKAIDDYIGDSSSILDQLFGHQDATGRDLHEKFGGEYKPKAVADKFHSMGIKGIKYTDDGSVNPIYKGSQNYVVFDDKLVNVKRKYAEGGSVAE